MRPHRAAGSAEPAAFSKSALLDLLPQFARVPRLQLRMGLRQPDQVQFILLPFAQTPQWIAIGPKLALSDIFQAGNLRAETQNLGFNGPGWERLVSRSEEHTSELQSLRHLV